MLDFILNVAAGVAVAIIVPIVWPSSKPAVYIMKANEWVEDKYRYFKKK